jgi:hypothetical protein
MTTQLSDIIIPENYSGYSNEPAVELNALYKSGVITTNPLIQSLANSGGQTVSMPNFGAISTNEPNTSSDDPAAIATALKQAAVKQVARISMLNQAWSSADLTAEVAGSDPLASVQGRLNTYWAQQMQRRLIATIGGVVADSTLNHSGDLIVDETGIAFNATGFLKSAQTLGDHKSNLVSLVVHSEVQTLMSQQDLIVYLPDSDGNFVFPTYKGLQLLVDDEVENDGTTFDNYLVGRGAFGSAMGTPKMPLEVDRSGLAGNGGGIENLISRTSPILHPNGYAWVEGTIAGDSPTNAELKSATHWNRVVSSRKLLPFAVYRCNLTTV